MKNHEAVLPMEKGKKVHIAVFAGEDAGAAIAQAMEAMKMEIIIDVDLD